MSHSFRRWLSLGLVVSLSLGAVACSQEPPVASPNVLLITLDTLRSDWIHAYGFQSENTPVIDGLADRGVLFENAIAAASLTAPSHGSIMTGRYAREHSIGTLNGESRLEGVETLADFFRQAGYETGAFVSNVVLRRRIGLDRGFDVYDDELGKSEENRPAYFERPAEQTAKRAIDWLTKRSGEKPFFMWLHLQDPHGPYTPPSDYEGKVGPVPLRMKSDLSVLNRNTGQAGIPAYQALPGVADPAHYAGRYAEEIMYADYWLGEVIKTFESRGVTREAVIVLTADHGESLGEQGYFFQHGQSVRPELARVPLIVVAPKVAPRKASDLVSHVDIVPTLIDLADLSVDPETSGISLRSSFTSDRTLDSRVVFSDTEGESGLYGQNRLTRVLGSALSSRAVQPGGSIQSESLEETESGAWRPVQIDTSAVEQISNYLDRAVELVPVGAMAEEHIEQLRALGYLDPEVGPDESNSKTPAQGTP